ncbi:hypothetical protein [Methylocella sp.]|jgi:hypothetical protein|uniref:hypothetical protein n=1 Tax=Methylocella sp. TaxID=1978226 RepID=UPI003C222ED3
MRPAEARDLLNFSRKAGAWLPCLGGALFAVSTSAVSAQPSLKGMPGAPDQGAQEQGTPEQRAACTPDAFSLCHAYIPDAERVKNCLIEHVNELSPPCREVFEHSENPQAQVK